MSEEITIEQFKKIKSKPKGLQFIENVLSRNNIDFVTEHKFSSERKFRFDIAFSLAPDKWAVEYDGLPFKTKKSGHTTIGGYTSNTEKFNLATIEGWKVLHYTAINFKMFALDLEKILKK